MVQAQISDKNLIINIISQSFDSNPHVNFVINDNSENRPRKLKAFSEYIFEIGFKRNGVFLSDDKQGVIIILDNKSLNTNVFDFVALCKFIFRVIGFSRIYQIQKLESQVKKLRYNSDNFLYVWFLGVSKQGLGKGNGIELIKYLFALAETKKLPIVAETSNQRNNTIFKRFGFVDYNYLETGINDLKIWFMKRNYNSDSTNKI